MPYEVQWRGRTRDGHDGRIGGDASLAPVGAWTCDLFDQSLRWSGAVYDLFGIDRGVRLDRRETVGFYTHDSRVAMERLRADAIAFGRAFTIDAGIVGGDGVRRWMRLDGAIGLRGGRRHLFGTKRDITGERAETSALRMRPDRCALTGLIFAREHEVAMPAVLIEVGGVGEVNRRYGHAAGDACLVAIADRLRAAFPADAAIVRVGGARFAVSPGLVAGTFGRLTLPVAWEGRLLHPGVTLSGRGIGSRVQPSPFPLPSAAGPFPLP